MKSGAACVDPEGGSTCSILLKPGEIQKLTLENEDSQAYLDYNVYDNSDCSGYNGHVGVKFKDSTAAINSVSGGTASLSENQDYFSLVFTQGGTPTMAPGPVPTKMPTVSFMPSQTRSPSSSAKPTLAETHSLSVGVPVSFDDNTIGPYDKDQFKLDWDVSMSSSEDDNLSIDWDPKNSTQKVLTVTYQANEVGGSSGMAFTAPLHGQYKHLSFSYDVLFPDDFEWGKGGKLPGLTSYADSPTGCIENDTFNGFSLRYMWMGNGTSSNGSYNDGLFYVYVYNPTKDEDCGDYYPAKGSSTVALKKGEWQTLKQEVFLGDPNVENGYFRVWIGENLFYEKSDIMLTSSPDISIDGAKVDSFRGGSDENWYVGVDTKAHFRSFAIQEA